MTQKKYKKLVRDRIPEIIKSNGQIPNTRILDEAEYRQELLKKLEEEIIEYKEAYDTNELADILEIIYAISKLDGQNVETLENQRRKKAEQNGAFDQRIYLEDVSIEDQTRSTYEDKDIVENYVQKNASNQKMEDFLVKFSNSLNGKKVIDIGCGPGQHSAKFAELGFSVVGIDYSYEMIKKAKELYSGVRKTDFRQMDMMDVGKEFDPNTFNAAWISASLIHVPESKVPQFLQDLHTILVSGGRAYIGLKGGKQGSEVVKESKYGKEMQREFIFWQKDNFDKLLADQGFKIIDFFIERSGQTGNQTTEWLNYIIEK